jgi:hypothetical protein
MVAVPPATWSQNRQGVRPLWGWRSLCSTSLQPRQARQLDHSIAIGKHARRKKVLTDIPTSRYAWARRTACLHSSNIPDFISIGRRSRSKKQDDRQVRIPVHGLDLPTTFRGLESAAYLQACSRGYADSGPILRLLLSLPHSRGSKSYYQSGPCPAHLRTLACLGSARTVSVAQDKCVAEN